MKEVFAAMESDEKKGGEEKPSKEDVTASVDMRFGFECQEGESVIFEFRDKDQKEAFYDLLPNFVNIKVHDRGASESRLKLMENVISLKNGRMSAEELDGVKKLIQNHQDKFGNQDGGNVKLDSDSRFCHNLLSILDNFVISEFNKEAAISFTEIGEKRNDILTLLCFITSFKKIMDDDWKGTVLKSLQDHKERYSDSTFCTLLEGIIDNIEHISLGSEVFKTPLLNRGKETVASSDSSYGIKVEDSRNKIINSIIKFDFKSDDSIYLQAINSDIVMHYKKYKHMREESDICRSLLAISIGIELCMLKGCSENVLFSGLGKYSGKSLSSMSPCSVAGITSSIIKDDIKSFGTEPVDEGFTGIEGNESYIIGCIGKIIFSSKSEVFKQIKISTEIACNYDLNGTVSRKDKNMGLYGALIEKIIEAKQTEFPDTCFAEFKGETIRSEVSSSATLQVTASEPDSDKVNPIKEISSETSDTKDILVSLNESVELAKDHNSGAIYGNDEGRYSNNIKIFDIVRIDKALSARGFSSGGDRNKLASSDKDGDKVVGILKQIREMTTVYGRNAIESDLKIIETAMKRFPNMKEVGGHIRLNFMRAMYSKSMVVTIDPILIVGKPGIGKTAFFLYLAEYMKIPLTFLNSGTLSTGNVLSGWDSTWCNSKQGVVFNTMFEHNMSNPLIILDEIDKVNNNTHSGSDVINPLYSLLEKQSAKIFLDEYLNVPVDASMISFIATANSIKTIPEPILDRFKVFNIETLTVEERTMIAKNMYAESISSFRDGVVPDKITFSGLRLIAEQYENLRDMQKEVSLLATKAINLPVLNIAFVRKNMLKNENKKNKIGF